MVSLAAQTGWLDPQHDEFVWPAAAQAGDLAVVVSFGSPYNGPDGFVLQGRSYRVTGPRGNSLSHSEYVIYTRMLGPGFAESPPWKRWGLRRQAAMVILRGTTGAGRVRVNDGRVPVRASGGGLILASPPSADVSLPSGWSWSGVATEPARFGGGPFYAAWGWAAASSDGASGSLVDYPSVVVELLPPKGPGEPVITNPSSGEISNAGDVNVSWQHRPSIQGGYQDRVQLRRESALDGTERWDGSGWVSGGATLYTSEGSLVLPGSSFDAGAPYLLSVRTREALDGQWSDWSTPVDVMAVTPPSVTVTAPSGAVSNDLSPLVEWTTTTPRGVQTAFRVRVVTALGSPVYDSGWRQGAAEGFTVPAQDWTNGGAYQVLLQVSQTGGSTSDYGSSDFTMSWSTPSVPEVSADPGRDGVAVAVAADGGSLVELERIRPNGTWAPVAAFTAPSNLEFSWTGTPGESTSIATRDGVTVRENLVPNPSFEYGTAGWSTVGGLVLDRASSGMQGVEGAWVGTVTSDGSSAPTSILAWPPNIPVTDSLPLSVAGSVRRSASGVPASVRLMVRAYDAGGANLGDIAEVEVSTLSGNPSSLNRAMVEDVTLPTGAASVRLAWYLTSGYDASSWTSGSLEIDAHMVVQAPQVGDYFDGDSPDAAVPVPIVDVFAPYGQSTAWRARAATVLEGAPRWSEWGMSDPVTPVHKLAYLASAVDPARTWQPLLIVDDSEHTRQTPTAVVYGLGDDRPRVTRGVYRGRAGSLILTAGHDDEQELDNLIALLESSEPLILRWSAEGAGDSIIDAGTLTFSVADSLATTRRAQVAVLRGRRISVSWVEQDGPGLGDTNAPITHPIEGV